MVELIAIAEATAAGDPRRAARPEVPPCTRRSISAPTTAACWSPRHGRGFRVVDAFSRIVRLGEGVGATGGSPKRIERTIDGAEDLRRQDAPAAVAAAAG